MTRTEMSVDLIDGMNACTRCGQRAGVDRDDNGEGYFVHDRTGRIECNGCECASCGEWIWVVRATGPMLAPGGESVWVHSRTGQRPCRPPDWTRDDEIGGMTATIAVARPIHH